MKNADQITHLFEIVDRHEKIFTAKPNALISKINGEWIPVSSKDFVEKVKQVSAGLHALGLIKGDRIATISNNRPEWNMVDHGMSQLGIVHVPVYTTIGADEFEYILRHSEPKLIFISDKHLYKTILPIKEKIAVISEIYTFDEVEGAHNWNEVLEEGKKLVDKRDEIIEKSRSEIQQEDLATIIYTSGTTGNPKGVMLSHKNIVTNLHSIGQSFDFTEKDSTVSFLPICHIYERTINYYFQHQGLSIFYAESMGTLTQNLHEVLPNVLILVPRVLEVVYDKIIGKGKDLTGIKKRIFFWAVQLGERFKFEKNNWWYNQQLKLADKLVFVKWREAIGKNIRIIMVGGAALQPRLARVFNAAGMWVGEGYGMTESSPVIAANNPGRGNNMPGTVGKVLNDIEVKIAEDGEILTRSDCVMMGYYKEPELTKDAIDEDGWLHTGDVGEMVDGIYLKITDRKKEIFKLSSGKYIAPQLIENKLKESFFIEQAMVVGENQKFASALISPNFQFIHEWCSRHNIKYHDNKDMLQNELVVKRFQREVAEINKQLGQFEQIKRIRLVGETWAPHTGELSPTLKLKRKYLTGRYKNLIEDIYKVEQSRD